MESDSVVCLLCASRSQCATVNIEERRVSSRCGNMASKLSLALQAGFLAALVGLIRPCERDVDGYDFSSGDCDLFKGLNVVPTQGEPLNDKTCNAVYRMKDFLEEPRFIYKQADRRKYYTLFILDPDAPKTPRGFFYLHLIRSNIPGSKLRKSEYAGANGGDKIVKYAPPTPPAGTGKHRYMIALYEQENGRYNYTAPAGRSRFPLEEWLRFKNLCGPIAGTQFRAYHEF